MILNNRHKYTGLLLALAFLLPIGLKTEHLMFSKHEHHAHACCQTSSSVSGTCFIQDFDYFFFTSAESTQLPQRTCSLLRAHRAENTQKIKTADRFDFHLRAPPVLLDL